MRRATPRTQDRKPTTGNRKLNTVNRPPLAEGIVPLKKNGQRDWISITDENLVSHANRYILEKGIRWRTELQKADRGLYLVLKKRGLLDSISFEKKQQKARSWKEMGDEEIIEIAKAFIEEKGISRRKELFKADYGLYSVLRKRKLLEEIGFEKKQRHWASVSNEELIHFAKTFMEQKEIIGRHELEKADPGLYETLRRRKLLDGVGFEGKKYRKPRDWASMNDKELIKYVKAFRQQKGINGRSELCKADPGLYEALRKRKLLGKVGFVENRRDWASMNDKKLIELAKMFLKKNEITGRKELSKIDQGLYIVLLRRKLLNLIFSSIEQTQSERAIEQIIDFTASFGERK